MARRMRQARIWPAFVALALLTQGAAGGAGEQEPGRGALDEGVAGERGRADLAALVKRSLDRSGAPRAVEVEEKERALGLALQGVEIPGVRVLATSGAEEAGRVARALEAARTLFQELFENKTSFPPGCTVYLLAGPEDRNAFLDRHPAVGAGTRAWMETLEGAGVPGTGDWAFWSLDQEQRLDGMVRFAFDWLFKNAWDLPIEKQAWLHEGFGFYLTQALVGTRLTWFVPLHSSDPRKDQRLAALQGRLLDPEVDWMAEARALFDAQQRFDLEELFHLEASELDGQDYLRSFALAAYLLEVHRPIVPGLLARLGADEDPRQVLEEQLGCGLGELRKRVDRWLAGRETLVARAEGRRTDAELSKLWKRLDGSGKRALVARLSERLATLDTQQLRLVRSLQGHARAEGPAAGEAPFYDPAVHAPGLPIARKRLPASDPRAKKLLSELVREPDARALRPAWRFDWGRGTVVKDGDDGDPETVFANALHGIPPGLDLARALALQRLDREGERALHAAFGHAYSDRDGNVYPGVTLYDMWSSGETIEMPDVDALGVVHELLNEWKRWVSPVPGTQHEALYRTIGELFQRCRRSRELREALADCLLIGHPVAREGFASLETNLHVLWALDESDPERLGRSLPDGEQWDGFLKNLVQRCKQDFELYSKGKRRSSQLKKDGDAVRAALIAVLDELVAAAPGSGGGGR